MTPREALKLLIRGFDDDMGVCSRVYIATSSLILNFWGMSASKIFDRHVEGTDDRYYIKEGTADDCLRAIEKEMRIF